MLNNSLIQPYLYFQSERSRTGVEICRLDFAKRWTTGNKGQRFYFCLFADFIGVSYRETRTDIFEHFMRFKMAARKSENFSFFISFCNFWRVFLQNWGFGCQYYKIAHALIITGQASFNQVQITVFFFFYLFSDIHWETWWRRQVW